MFMMMMKWIKIFVSASPTPTPKPLGRWSQCGEKMTVSDILEFKNQQKGRRLHLLETGTDPYHAVAHPPSRDVVTEEYMRPFVVQLKSVLDG
jgi:hypothetical protein